MGLESTKQGEVRQLAGGGETELGPEGWIEFRQAEGGHFNGQNLHQASHKIEVEA